MQVGLIPAPNHPVSLLPPSQCWQHYWSQLPCMSNNDDIVRRGAPYVCVCMNKPLDPT